jgi:hypothetical protein
MEKTGNMAGDSLIRRPFQSHRSSPPRQRVGPEEPGQPRQTRISNRKSGIRIPRKPWEISAVQISNRKYSVVFYPGTRRVSHESRRAPSNRHEPLPRPVTRRWPQAATISSSPQLLASGFENPWPPWRLIYGGAIRNPRKALKT